MSTLAWASWGGVLLVVFSAAAFRSRAYAIFRGVILSIYTLIALSLLPVMSSFFSALPLLGRSVYGVPVSSLALYYLHLVVYLDPLLLIRPRIRPSWYRASVSVPAMYLAASMLLAFPWAIVGAFGVHPYGWGIPFVLGAFGLWQSLSIKKEEHSLYVGEVMPTQSVSRVAHPQAGVSPAGPPLRIVQITDPHLGPFMSVARLRSICERAVAEEPDLVVLTGDFLTMESQADAAWLSEALSPLLAIRGKTFACLGNHDHEALQVVVSALSSAGVRLLVDEQTQIETPLGAVQILGFDFHFRERPERTRKVLEEHPRAPGALRLVLLHDPGAFRHLPPGSADLVLSGHTHGGQVGLHSLGKNWTIAYAVAKIPDHSLWGNGRNRLWVHRGTGHYGFPLRLGVSAEESVLAVYRV